MGLFDKIFSPPKSQTSGKNPQVFDSAKEKELIKEYKPHKGKKNSDEYYSALPFIDFYYKFRNLDEKYLNKCIEYCNLCISCLDSPDMIPFLKEGITIPAFRKLIIIFENKKDYKKAEETAKLALRYTSTKSKEEAQYYSKKMIDNHKRQFN